MRRGLSYTSLAQPHLMASTVIPFLWALVRQQMEKLVKASPDSAHYVCFRRAAFTLDVVLGVGDANFWFGADGGRGLLRALGHGTSKGGFQLSIL